jgi:cell division protein FtsB
LIRETLYPTNQRPLRSHARLSAVVSFPSAGTDSGVFWAAVRESTQMIPSGVLIGMILLASICICAAVISRTQAELNRAASEYQQLASDVNTARRINAGLQLDIQRAQSDPVAIESIARARLGMVRPADLVVPVPIKSDH